MYSLKRLVSIPIIAPAYVVVMIYILEGVYEVYTAHWRPMTNNRSIMIYYSY